MMNTTLIIINTCTSSNYQF